MGKQVTVFFLLLLLSACQPATPALPTPIGTVTRPELVPLINWERAPLSVIFRAEATRNTTDTFENRSEIADCAVYGDNRVVYTASNGLGINVAWQRVDDEPIRLFVDDLVNTFEIYNQRAGLDALPAEQRPLLTETVLLVVNGQAHYADSYGGWTEDFYRRITERCRAIADSPSELLPASGYVSVQPVSYNENQPSMEWDAASGIDLSALGAERRWFTGAALQTLWTAQRTAGAGIQVRQGENVYLVAVEVPGVSRYAPPPP